MQAGWPALRRLACILSLFWIAHIEWQQLRGLESSKRTGTAFDSLSGCRRGAACRCYAR